MPSRSKTHGLRKAGSSNSTSKTKTQRRVYPKYDRAYRGPESVYATMSPSTLAMSVKSPLSVSKKTAPVPEVIEFLDLRSSTQPNSHVSVDEPIFQPLVPSLVFGEYEPFRTYTQKLYFRNNDNVARRMKIMPSDSPYFSVSAPMTPGGKKGASAPRKDGTVAAGMELCFDVTFKPQEKRHYSCRLVCVTEREKFVVPVVAMGTVACLDFQDQYDFGDVPCKSRSKQTFTVRNTGTAPAAFSLSTQGPFKASATDSFVPVGGSTQVVLEFCPPESRDYSGSLVVSYSDGASADEKVGGGDGGGGDSSSMSSLGSTVHIDLTGSGADVEVGMTVSSLSMEDTYISLSSHKVVKLFNRSGIPVKYSWKAFATEDEEQQERDRLLHELDRMEAIERDDIRSSNFEADGDSDLSSDEDDAVGGAAMAAALSALTRKYKNLRKAVHDDPFHFVTDENFKVDPVQGELWPGSEVEVVVTFLPSIASEYRSEIFLDITGQEQRAVLDVRGVGIGPKAMFSYDVLDIGDVFLGSKHKYKLSLQNKGDIEAHYQLQPRDHGNAYGNHGPTFLFSPAAGVLAVGDTHVLDIDFTSDVLGEFSEQFTFNLRGSSETLSVHFKGHVVGPTFHFDAEELDFGRVSFEFLHSKNLCLYNTSEIPMDFKLRVPQDGKMADKEFDIIPASGAVLPGGKQSIRLDFISTTAKVYEYFLTVDVKGVGEGLCSIPILAECGVPEVKLVTPQLEYGSCFLRHGYRKDLVVKNESPDLRARFEILPQDRHSKALAEYTTPTQRGIIEPNSELAIDLSLVCNRLGNVKLPVYVRISGSEKPPLLPVVTAAAMGPIISADVEVLDWRKIPCLRVATRTIRLTNESLIPAPYQALIKNLRSKFAVGPPPAEAELPQSQSLLGDDDAPPPLLLKAAGGADVEEDVDAETPGEGVLAPGESRDLVISCNLDDTTLHKDTLTIVVTEGEPLSIGLVARGTGTTMHCDEDLSVIDFGFQFTNGTCTRKFLLENKGRRSQSLNWINTTIKEAIAARRKAEHAAKLEAAAAEKAGGRRRKPKKLKGPKEIKPVFTVTPESIELKPRTACYFEFTGAVSSPAVPEEVLVCEARVGNEQKGHPVFNTVVRATFIDPLLEPSTRSMSFEYTYEPDVPLTFQRQPLTLKNISELPLEFTLKTQVPFNVDSYEFSLQPGESASLNVEFDPGYNDDRTSCKVDGQITIVYAGHPQRDTVNLSGVVNFPNLQFDFREVDFGCVLNDTVASSVVRITNVSTVDVDFNWLFVEDEDEQRAAASDRTPFIPINKAFDILPIRGLLKPGEFEDVEVGFFGHANRAFSGLAVCEVEGGPEYEVTLKGEASDIEYSLDFGKDHVGEAGLNFGAVIHSKFEEREFAIVNLGKVPFSFRFDLDHLTGPHKIVVSPMQGRIFEKDKQRVVVRCSPQVPQEILDKLVVEIAHFEAIDIPIVATGIYAQASFSLPFVEPESWPRLMDEAAQALAERAARVQAAAETAAAATAAATAVGVGTGVAADAGSPPGTAVSGGRTSRAQSPKGKKRRRSKGRSADEMLLLDTELEARRRFFMEFLMNIVATEGSLDRLLKPPSSRSRAQSRMQTPRLDATQASAKSSVAGAAGGLGDFVLAEHTADFGNVVAGTSKKKTFRVTNFGSIPVSFSLDKRLPLSHGFTVEPEKVQRLPEGASVDFTIKFKARKSAMGSVAVDVPIDIKGGPPVSLRLRANVTVPDIVIAPNRLDFGDVVVGQCRVVTVQVTNTAPVTAEWVIKHLPTLSGAAARSAARFVYEPDHGTLRPGERQNVRITFTPTAEQGYSYTAPFRVASNPAQKFLEVAGAGKLLALSFDPPHLALPTVRPYDPPVRQTVELINNSDYAIEVYSTDFDQRYLVEEARIQDNAEAFDNSGVLLAPPRVPGAGLPEVLLPDDEANALRADAETRPFVRRHATDFVVVGPRLSGKSTQAKCLADKYDLPILSITNVVADALGRTRQRREAREAARSAAEAKAAEDGEQLAPETPDKLAEEELAMAPDQLLERNLWRHLHSIRNEAQWGVVVDGVDTGVEGLEQTQVLAALVRVLKESEPKRFQLIQLQFEDGEAPQPERTDGADVANEAEPNQSEASKPEIVPGLTIHRDNVGAATDARSTALNEEKASLEETLPQLKAEAERLDAEVAALDQADAEAAAAASSGDDALESKATDDLDAAGDASDQAEKAAAEETRAAHFAATQALASSEQRLAVIADLLREVGTLKEQIQTLLVADVVDEYEQTTRPIILEALAPLLQAEAREAAPQALDQGFAVSRDDQKAIVDSADEETKEQSGEEDVVETGVPIDQTRVATVNASQSVDVVSACVGIELDGRIDVPASGKRSELDILPEPQTFAIIRHGTARLPAAPLTKFRIENAHAEEHEPSPEEVKAAAAAAAAAQAAAKGKAGKRKKGPPEPEPEVQPDVGHATRWVLPPHGSAAFDVVFQSDAVGKFDANLGFEIVGDARQFSLSARGTCAVPSVNTDARNVFMSRVKGGRPENISHKYVTSRERFEFGPLLVGKDAEFGAQTVFRLSNNSDFPVEAQVAIFEPNGGGAGSGGGKGKGSKGASAPTYPFSVEPAEMVIAQGETQEITVKAFPSAPGEYNNEIICCLKDNPDPVRFGVHCIGAAPVLQMDGPWSKPVAAPAAANGEEPAQPLPVKLPDGVNGLLDFQRLLLNRMEEQAFTLQNGSDIPVRWRINTDALQDIPELSVLPSEGVLDPGARVYVTVTFRTSDEERDEVRPVLLVEYADNEAPAGSEDGEGILGGGGSPVQTLKLMVKAEAYKIDPSLGLTDESGAEADKLVFGPARVHEAVEHSVTLGNNGKYEVSFDISCRQVETAELFTIEPASGVIAPGSTATVNLRFESPTEVHLKNNKDILVKIIEVQTGEVESEFDITVDADAEFSKLRLQPLRGLNFGALRFGSERSRNFELRNDGIFPFKFKVVPLEPGTTDIAAALEAAAAEASQATLSSGAFEITPASGEILPNARLSIAAKFTAKDAEVCKSLFFIDISNRDDRVDPRALLYELVGESCIPAINSDDFLSVFEEQDVVHKLDPANHTLRAFATEENTFTFGAVVPSAYPDGLRERFKITNISKVRATARFAVEGAAPGDEGIFTVQPPTADLPPHEHRYISVYFKPQQMKSYSALFKATVDDSKAAEGAAALSFELHGDGAMPSVSITKPLTRDATSGSVLMDFARTHLGKLVRLQMVLQNDGIVPSTVTFAMDEHPQFTLSARDTSVTLPPGASHTVEAMFRPTTIAPDPETGAPRDECEVTHNFTVNVLNNKFEREVVALRGMAFQDRITFEDLPPAAGDEGAGPAQDELAFGDIDISSEDDGQQVAFGIRNHSDAVVRFRWPQSENFLFVPATGHIPVGSTKEITATFVSNGVAANYDRVPIELAYQLVTLVQPEDGSNALDDWDDTQKNVRYGEDGDGSENDEQITEVVPEPSYEAYVDPLTQKAATERSSTLYCTAHADRVTYECDCPAVLSVRDTMMFQSRTFTFEVRNTCETALSYSWGEPVNHGTSTDLVDVACPFLIEPTRGKVPPGQTQQFTLAFSPMEAGIFAYRADCTIGNLADGMQPLSLQMSGRGVRPVCHFDLPPSDYLVRRKPGQPGPNGGLGPLDPAIRVIEVSSLGIKVKNRCRFVAINPMNSSYEFLWEPVGAPNAVFRCLTQRGIIPAGKRFEMSFEFTPVQLTGQAQESFWRFSIPQRNLSATFLLAGEVVEPRVTMTTSHINFRQLLLGAAASETVRLVNHEHLPFQFAFNEPAVESDGVAPITVEPMRGVVSANSTAEIKVHFKPSAEKDYNANLLCEVRGKPGPLALNVKGEGYAVHEAITLVDGEGSESHDVQTVGLRGSNPVDFGAVQINGDATKTVVLSNTGRIHYEFMFSPLDNPFVTITPAAGTVRRGEKFECELKFHPTRECRFADLPLTCTIARARKYTMKLAGQGVKAALQFSFREYSFPPCFVGVADGERHSKQTVLRITNNEPHSDVSLECLFERTPVLDVSCDPTVLRPHQSLEVPMIFTPRAVQQYNLAVTFEVNGLYKVPVLLQGEGIALRVELAEPVMRDQDFGAVKPHQEVVRRVRLVNRSKQTASFELLEEEDMAGEGQLASHAVSFWPRGVQSLPPRAGVDVELRFAPTARIPSFRETLLLKAAGSVPVELIAVTGSCVAIDVHMDTDCIPFGKVGERSKVVRKLRMENSGDVGARYSWNASAFGPHFSISPEEGYLGPHGDVTFDVAFHPAFVDSDIRNDRLRCAVDGMEALPLTLTGLCVEGPAAEELRFETKVREPSRMEVEITNSSRVAWHLRPSFENSYFSGPDILEVPAGKSAKYEITYTPLSMTARQQEGAAAGAVEHEEHEGSLFFGLPDGTARQWRLFGQANEPSAAPLPEGLALTAPAKTTHAIHLPVRNWLPTQQRFDVVVDIADVDATSGGGAAANSGVEAGRKSVFVTAAKNVAVPPLGQRMFKLSLFAYTAGRTPTTVRFVNPETGEYLFYELVFEATAPGVWGTVALQTMCRQPAKHVVTVENPAPEHGKIQLPGGADSREWWTCSTEEVRVREVTELCGPAESSFEIEYRPVAATLAGGAGGDKIEPTTAELEINCGPALGVYKYTLSLTATEPGIERTLHFKAPLGATQSKAFRFRSVLQSAAPTFEASVEKPLFFGLEDNKVAVAAATEWEGVPAEVTVIFEPEQVGKVTDVLTLESPNGGTFRCALVGECTAPTPQGPFVVKKGATVQIPFKNVFNNKQAFDFSVDRPDLFAVSPASTDLNAKASTTINVSRAAQAADGGGGGVSGRLIVSPRGDASLPPWIFYLTGE